MTPRRAATTLLVLLAALVWAPLGVSSLGGPQAAAAATASHLPVTDPESSPSPGAGTAAPAPVASPVAAATRLPAPTASAMVVAHAVPGGAKPAASVAPAGRSATPATLRSASPATSSRPRPVPSPSPAGDRPPTGQPRTPAEAESLTWLLVVLTGLALVGCLLVLVGHRQPRDDRPALAAPGSFGTGGAGRGAADDPVGSPMVERRRSGRPREDGIERRAPSRLLPADDPVLSAMGLGPDAPAAGGARAVRARARRVRQGLEPGQEDARPD